MAKKMDSVIKMFLLVWCIVIIIDTVVLLEIAKDAQIVYKWRNLDYDWENSNRDNIDMKSYFIQENNIITGIKVYNSRVFVTVPRWRLGVPSTLNEVVKSPSGNFILRPFPNWDFQKIGHCSALQYVQSMEIDPNTGYMWIIDTGRINTMNTSGVQAVCDPKLVIYDITNQRVVRTHIFPNNVVSPMDNFLNDLVIDYVDGEASYAYISDTSSVLPKLVVYNYKMDNSYYFAHESMVANGPYRIILKDGDILNITVSMDGIAVAPDFQRVYYTTLSNETLYSIPTAVLRDENNREFSKHVTDEGYKAEQCDGMIFSQKALYLSSLTNGMVYRRTITENSLDLRDMPLFSTYDTRMTWIDTFSIDEEGNLWFVANNLHLFSNGRLDFKGSGQNNMFIWKVNISEHSYLYNAISRTKSNQTNEASKIRGWIFNFVVGWTIYVITKLS